MLYHVTFFMISTMYYQVGLLQLHWSTLMYRRHLKRMTKLIKKILAPLVSSQIYAKCTKDLCMTKYTLFWSIFSEMQCSFCNDFNAEQCLMHMIEEWRKYLDISSHDNVLFRDLLRFFLSAACPRFAMVRISDNGLGWK